MKRLLAKVTWKRVRWFLKTNVQSWIIQGAIAGVLTLAGISAVAAVVSAKVTAYVVFVGQCFKASRG